MIFAKPLYLFQPRRYRDICISKDLVAFNVTIEESDLYIKAESLLYDKAFERLRRIRCEIEEYIYKNRRFADSLTPVKCAAHAPEIIKKMCRAAEEAGVGPMAAVAGAVAEELAYYLHRYSGEVIVENGGDVFVINRRPMRIGIYTEDDLLSMKLGLELMPYPEGISICTSSGKIGHSLSFGRADAVTVLAPSGAYADAAATAVANMIQSEADIDAALDFAQSKKAILGVVVVINNKIGVKGEIIKFCALD